MAARAAAQEQTLRRHRGVTVIELMVAILIGVLLVVIAAVSLREIDRVNLRSGSRLVAATIRFAFDRSRSTGRDHRLVFDLDAEGGAKLTFEVAQKGKQLMPRDLDEAWKQHQKLADGEEAECDGGGDRPKGGGAGYLVADGFDVLRPGVHRRTEHAARDRAGGQPAEHVGHR